MEQKGIIEQLKNGTKPYSGDINEIFNNLELMCIKDKERCKKEWELKEQRIMQNLETLNKRSKELNKQIPMMLLAAVYSDRPQGSWFFEKYKEWL